MSAENEILGHYYFLPWVREGLATLIDTALADALCAPEQRVRVDIGIDLTGEGGAGVQEPSSISQPVELYGPGDIIGFNERVITRREPERDVGDFEPNYFPFLEFEQPDFPWRFTACQPDTNGRLTSWITLIVLIAEGDDKEFDEGCPSSDFPNPTSPCITVTNLSSLPDLNEAWRWAHVQVTTEGFIPNEEQASRLADIIQNDPNSVVAQLMCARRLRTGTLYQAFVVPSFRLGVLAGLGLEPLPAISAGVLAWEHEAFNEGDVPYYTESGISLPYYYTWQFRTGLRGDFEALVRRLEPRKLTGLGIRDVDCGNAGYDLPPVTRTSDNGEELHSLGLEGALMSLDMEPTGWGHDALDWTPGTPTNSFQDSLEALVNLPKADLEQGTDTPKVVPPIYGRWHAARDQVDPRQNTWIDTLNLDPRHRMVAAFGTTVVQKQQEQLMASAWDQVGTIDEANEILRRAQMGREASLHIHKRLGRMSMCDVIRVMSPVHGQVRINSPVTLRQYLNNSRIPSAALDPALCRIGRRRGPLRKRQRRTSNTPSKDMLERLNDGSLRAAGRHPDPDGALSVCGMSFRLLGKWKLMEAAEKLCPDAYKKDPRAIAEALNLFCPVNITCDAIKEWPGQPDFTGKTEDLAGKKPTEGKDSKQAANFREALLAICEKLQPEEVPEEGVTIDLDKVGKTLMEELDPKNTVKDRAWQRLHFVGVREQEDPLDQIMAAPEFDAAMYEPLQAISQDLLLPGLETVPQNTLALLRTNGRFVESYIVGLNHEMARELLWREYPTDQRGSYFRQFWDVNNYIATDEEINQLFDDYKAEKEITSISDLDVNEKVLVMLRNEERVVHDLDLSQSEMDEVIEELRKGQISGDQLTRIDELVEILVKEDLLEKKLKDIKPIHHWRANKLGENDNRSVAVGPDGENVVLLIRGDLLRKYPNTVIYAVQGHWITDEQGQPKRVPALPEHYPDENPPDGISEEEWPGEIKHPIFSGQLPPDVTFLGFEMTDTQAKGNSEPSGAPGWYFVIEERVSESRFGMDMATAPESYPPSGWDAISWGHITDLHETDPETGETSLKDDVYLNASAPTLPSNEMSWGDSSASIAWITLQKPVRIAVHASKMIPEDVPE